MAGTIEKPSSQVSEVKLAERSAEAESKSNKESGGAQAAGGGNEGGMGAARSKDHMSGGEASKLESSELKGAEREYFAEQDGVLPIQQPTSDPTLTCSGLDAGIQIEDFIKDDNETEEAKGSENASQSVEHAKDRGTVTVEKTVTVEVTEKVEVITEKKTVLQEGAAGCVEHTNVEAGDAPHETTGKSTNSEQGRKNEGVAQAVPITTTAGENEQVIVGPIPTNVDPKGSTPEDGNKEKETATRPGSGNTDKETPKAASNSCVVNMASVDDELKTGSKTKDSRKGTKSSSNGAVRSKKNKEDQQVAISAPSSSKPTEPKKRGRKPGKRSEKAPDKEASGEAKQGQAAVDLTTQPFSDAQQVQLRAQILVYGAIIQGSLPDESLMGAAFTDISKVRSLESFESHYGAAKIIWEKTWKATSERILRTTGHVPKVIGYGGAPIAPVLRPPPSLNSSSTITSVNLPPPSAKSSKAKGTKNAAGTSSASEFPSMSPLAYSMMSMASATVASWNSARARAPPLDPWQLTSRSRFSFPQTGIFPATTSTSAALHGPWGTPSQLTAPVIGPWGVLSQASFTTGSQLPFGAASQASAGVTSTFPSLLPSVSFSSSFLPPVIVGSSGLLASAETEKHGEGQAAEPKTKRRRKDQGSDVENSPAAASQSEAPDVSPATAGILKDRPASNDTERILSPEDLEKITSAEDFVHRLETAKQRAEDAASAAAFVVQQSQSAWDQIKEKRRTNSMSSKDAQLASCVAAITAAASVAKAAAAAANVAYAAALEAKAMANEAAASSKVNDTDPTVTHVTQDDERANINWGLPSSCKSIIAGAKEASKEQLKAASAACRRAENLDAVVRAAELAAEAATQAGAVMSIGDPASLALESGDANEKRAKEGKTKASGGKKNARSKASGHEKKGEETQDKIEEQSVEIAEDGKETADNVTEDDARADERVISSDTAKAAAQGDVVDLDAEPSEGMVEDKQQNRPPEITEGSHVEIVPDEEGLQGVWFSAKVLSIKGDEALVVYDDLLSDEGNGQLEEWVNLTSQIDNIPRVRVAHPMTKDGGMRKRRRAAMGSQTWMQDDHVDVWMRDGWWEGIVQSLDEEESLVTVFFPGDGDTEVTKSWNLRPSLIWQDGAWVPWRDTQAQKKPKVEGGLSPLTSQESQKPQQETPETPTGKRKKPSETTPKTTETPKPRTGAKPTKRRKFSDVIEKDQEARATQDASSKDDKKKSLQSVEKNKKKADAPKAKSKESTSAKKQTSPKSKKASKDSKTPLSGNKKAKDTSEKQKKKSTSSDVTTDAAEKDHSKDGEVRKSSRMIHPTSKLLEGLESTPKTAKKNGPASSGT